MRMVNRAQLPTTPIGYGRTRKGAIGRASEEDGDPADAERARAPHRQRRERARGAVLAGGCAHPRRHAVVRRRAGSLACSRVERAAPAAERTDNVADAGAIGHE
jgi:hypothetical protein